MKKALFTILFSLTIVAGASAQVSLVKAKELYKQGKYAEAMPAFQTEYEIRPTDPALNQWLGVCLFETGGDIQQAQKYLELAASKKIRDSFLYLGLIYTRQYKVEEAKEMFDSFEKQLRRIKVDNPARERLEECRAVLSKMNRFVTSTEDIQIIDSLVLDKKAFLDAYAMSLSTGKLSYFNDFFPSEKQLINSTVYINEKGSKIYYAAPNPKTKSLSLYSKEKLMDEYSKEKPLSEENFGLTGDVNYPFMLTDGVTIYFAANDEESIGGYDLFASRYNMNNDTYLNPERLNAPFNSIFNDYMLVIDEEKGVGWFASDRFQPEGKVCVYTFIPNDIVNMLESEDMTFLANRAQIKSIKETWKKGVNYTSIINTARQKSVEVVKKVYDFTFVINDDLTYHSISDFKSLAAMDTYNRVLQMKKDLVSVVKQLESERDAYTKASSTDKTLKSRSIRTLENQQEVLVKDIKETEKVARRQEISEL